MSSELEKTIQRRDGTIKGLGRIVTILVEEVGLERAQALIQADRGKLVGVNLTEAYLEGVDLAYDLDSKIFIR